MTPSRIAQERAFTTHDDVSLFYRHWPATGATRRGTFESISAS